MNPLDQLADISTPSTVSMWPLAWGYWIAMALILFVIVTIVIFIYRYLRRTKQKRHSLAQLNALDCKELEYIPKVQLLLKQACAAYFPSHQVNTMHTSAWQHFVSTVYAGNNTEQVNQAVSEINHHLYAPQINAQGELSQPTNAQIQKHHQIKIALTDFIKSSLPASKATQNKLTSFSKRSKADDIDAQQSDDSKKGSELAHV